MLHNIIKLYSWAMPVDDGEYYLQGEGPMFRIGAIRSESVDHDHDPNNPNCFAWCLMNLCIAKILQSAVRKVLNTASLEVLGELKSTCTCTQCTCM